MAATALGSGLKSVAAATGSAVEAIGENRRACQVITDLRKELRQNFNFWPGSLIAAAEKWHGAPSLSFLSKTATNQPHFWGPFQAPETQGQLLAQLRENATYFQVNYYNGLIFLSLVLSLTHGLGWHHVALLLYLIALFTASDDLKRTPVPKAMMYQYWLCSPGQQLYVIAALFVSFQLTLARALLSASPSLLLVSLALATAHAALRDRRSATISGVWRKAESVITTFSDLLGAAESTVARGRAGESPVRF